MRSCGDDVRELMHDGCPVACVEDAPFCYVNVFKAHVNVGFFYGAELNDPQSLLEGSGKRMRHVKVKPGAQLDPAAMCDMIDVAYVDIKSRQSDDRAYEKVTAHRAAQLTTALRSVARASQARYRVAARREN